MFSPFLFVKKEETKVGSFIFFSIFVKVKREVVNLKY